MSDAEMFDAVVVGGGPAGATAAADLAGRGRSVLLLDRAGRIKPCGGAIPPILVREFAIPDGLIVARATGARIVSPSAEEADMPIEGGYVGMVDRETFDEWLRERAAGAGAVRRAGTFDRFTRDDDGVAVIEYRGADGPAQLGDAGADMTVAAEPHALGREGAGGFMRGGRHAGQPGGQAAAVFGGIGGDTRTRLRRGGNRQDQQQRRGRDETLHGGPGWREPAHAAVGGG